MSMELWQFPVIFTVGVVAGVINTLAGGGSLITLPVLIFPGLPTTVANGTNRLAITVQSVLAVTGLKGTVQYDGGMTCLSRSRRTASMLVFFFIGVYGGFIQAGIGFLIIAVLTTISGLNLVETNSHKVFIVGVNAFFTLIVFIFNSKICWPIGLALAAGNGLGGWIGSHLSVTKGERFIKLILAICVVGMVVKLLI